jgi:hypothetical protein
MKIAVKAIPASILCSLNFRVAAKKTAKIQQINPVNPANSKRFFLPLCYFNF